MIARFVLTHHPPLAFIPNRRRRVLEEDFDSAAAGLAVLENFKASVMGSGSQHAIRSGIFSVSALDGVGGYQLVPRYQGM